MVTLSWHWIAFMIILTPLIIATFFPYRSNAGNFTPDTSVFTNLLFGIVSVLFVLIWGGIFWW